MPRLQLDELVFFGFLILFIVTFPILAYLISARTRRRKQIAERGINALGGKCPKCGGKLKVLDLFAGRASASLYKIGAAKCTRCGHLEVFSEEP